MSEKTRLMALPPCIVLCGPTSLKGDIRYEKLEDQEESLTRPDGTTVKTTTTRLKVVEAVEELTETRARINEIKSKMRAVTRPTILGPVCSRDREAELDAFIVEAKQIAAAHNAKARHHFIEVPYVKAYIATNDEAAAREMAAQLQGMVEDLRRAVDEADPEKIRGAVLRAKNLVGVVGKAESETLDRAIEAARRVARTLAREVEKKGRLLEEVRAELDTAPLDRARAMCAEFDLPVDVRAMLGETPQIERGAEIDMAAPPLEPPVASAEEQRVFAFEDDDVVVTPAAAQAFTGGAMELDGMSGPPQVAAAPDEDVDSALAVSEAAAENLVTAALSGDFKTAGQALDTVQAASQAMLASMLQAENADAKAEDEETADEEAESRLDTALTGTNAQAGGLDLPTTPAVSDLENPSWWNGPGRQWALEADLSIVESTLVSTLSRAIGANALPLAQAALNAIPATRSANLLSLQARMQVTLNALAALANFGS